MDRRWVCLATLGPIGVASLVYVVVMRGFIDPDVNSDHGLAWPLLGALPLFVFGMWLLTVSASRIALLIAARVDRDARRLGLRDLRAAQPRNPR